VRFDDYFAKKMLVNSSLNYLCFVHSSCYFVEILFVALEGENAALVLTLQLYSLDGAFQSWSVSIILCLFFFYKM